MLDQLRHSGIVSRGEIDRLEVAGGDRPEKRRFMCRTAEAFKHVANFSDHRRRHKQSLAIEMQGREQVNA